MHVVNEGDKYRRTVDRKTTRCLNTYYIRYHCIIRIIGDPKGLFGSKASLHISISWTVGEGLLATLGPSQHTRFRGVYSAMRRCIYLPQEYSRPLVVTSHHVRRRELDHWPSWAISYQMTRMHDTKSTICCFCSKWRICNGEDSISDLWNRLFQTPTFLGLHAIVKERLSP